MNTEDIIAKREEDKRKLAAVIDAFAEEMKARAFQKVDEGYSGWDGTGWDVAGKIYKESRQLLDVGLVPERRARKCVDIANFAMFGWQRIRRHSAPQEE